MKAFGAVVLWIGGVIALLAVVMVLGDSSPKSPGTPFFLGILLILPSVFVLLIGLLFYGAGSALENERSARMPSGPRPFSATFEPDGYGVRFEMRWPARGEAKEREAARVLEALIGLASVSPILSGWRRKETPEELLFGSHPTVDRVIELTDGGGIVQGRLGKESLGAADLSFRLDDKEGGFLRLEILGGTNRVGAYGEVDRVLGTALEPTQAVVYPQDLARLLGHLTRDPPSPLYPVNEGPVQISPSV